MRLADLMKDRGPWRRWMLVAGWAFPGLACNAVAAELSVVTEYRYPTEFEIQGGLMTAGNQGANFLTETVVVPMNFQTRLVGVVFSVEATISDLGAANATLTSLEQNRNGNTPLMLAATAGEVEQVKKLLARGSIVNARNHVGATALMGASAGGFEEVVSVLLQKGASVSSQANDGSTALMFAAKNGHLGVVKMLLAKEANVNAADRHSRTALMYAINGEYADIVQLLLEKGVNSNFVDGHGTTPRMLASTKKNEDLIVLLTKPAQKK